MNLPETLLASQRFSISTPATTAAFMPVMSELTELAEGIGATDFSLIGIPGGLARRPQPVMDCAYPDAASITQALLADLPAAMQRHALSSTIVSWWAAPGHVSAARFERLRWAVETTPLCPGRCGLAFPVYAGRSDHGLLVMTGPDLAVDDALLADTHVEALALFARLVSLRDAHAGRPLLSRRELECLRLTSEGQTSEEIASGLGLSIHTANQYLANACQKLDAVNRMHAVAKALRLGLID